MLQPCFKYLRLPEQPFQQMFSLFGTPHYKRFVLIIIGLMNIPKMQIPTKILNAVCMVSMSNNGDASDKDWFPIYIPTTIVTIAMLEVCPSDLIVVKTEEATP